MKLEVFCPLEFVPALVRDRAYQFFVARGHRNGHELDDWLVAEQEIQRELELWNQYEFGYAGYLFNSQGARKDEPS